MERVCQVAADAALNSDLARGVQDMAAGMATVCNRKFSEELALIVQKFSDNLSAAHGELARLMASPKLKQFRDDLTQKELTDDVWGALYDAACGDDGRKYHLTLKQWKKLRSSVADVLTNLGHFAAAGEPVDDDQLKLKQIAAKVDEESQRVLSLIGELSAVQALCRPLAPGETRVMLAKRVSTGLEKDQMTIAAPLSAALKQKAQG